MELDLAWDRPLTHRRGAKSNLCGVDVFHDFPWRAVFPDERTQFKNGKCLAEFIQAKCPAGKTAAILLTLQSDVKQGFRQTDEFAIIVVNPHEYRSAEGDAALSYVADRLDVDITDIEQLEEIATSADPAVIRAFVGASLDIQHIAEWALDNEERVKELRELVGTTDAATASLADTLAALGAVEDIPASEVRVIAEFLGASTDREQRLELARAATADPTGRYVTGEVFAERTAQRIQDARDAVARYQDLLDDPTSTETNMQQFIEKNLWLLGLDYAALRPRQSGPSGAMDFMLERFDGFHDLLELKSPQDQVIKAPDIAEGVPVPPPHEYALSKTLGQALAQALVYRDRLTRHAAAAEELHGLPQPRDPRLIIVIGRADALPEHRRRVLFELNKSLHRVEVVPYDVIVKRAEAVLTNLDAYFGAVASEEGQITTSS